ncbi:MAG TPA: metalloregulator ArsR/SmtB family transcription factor [Paracoccaceae bacterium]|nr:metalloregulator ArsR/SmtB family transcription factor [Paracoccaceae bacterium]HMO70404.1 metalloregulator ArsR/SmtB family transcription factor [Paracoccaceae bacterium]
MENQFALLDRAFAALSDPTRRAVVARLCLGEASVGELAGPFAIGLPTFLKHIRVLEEGGLVETRKAGRVRYCALRPEALRRTDAWLDEHLRIWAARLDRMEAHIRRLQENPDEP